MSSSVGRAPVSPLLSSITSVWPVPVRATRRIVAVVVDLDGLLGHDVLWVWVSGMASGVWSEVCGSGSAAPRPGAAGV